MKRAPGDTSASPGSPIYTLFAISGGALCLLWPALANNYPILFSDSGWFLRQALLPMMLWDKPWIYGPVLAASSLTMSLWLPVFAQGMLVSWVLWRVQAIWHPPSPWHHLSLCLLLALGSAASWFTSLLMPDIMAPLTVLLLFLTVFTPARERSWAPASAASFAIAAHLAHVPLAAACLLAALALQPTRLVRAATPLVAGVALLLVTNVIGHGRLGISPHGAVFALARLTADGPARMYLDESCPASGHRLCDWAGRLPSGANDFLWDPNGPVWTYPGGPAGLAPEAADITRATILAYPWAVARSAVANTASQFITLRLDTVLGNAWLDQSVGSALRDYYPAREYLWFMAGAQRADGLRAIAAPWQLVHMSLLAAGVIGSTIVLFWSWRRDRRLFTLTTMIVTGIVANAFATGALSGVQDRYQARIAWLILLPPVLLAIDRARQRPATLVQAPS